MMRLWSVGLVWAVAIGNPLAALATCPTGPVAEFGPSGASAEHGTVGYRCVEDGRAAMEPTRTGTIRAFGSASRDPDREPEKDTYGYDRPGDP